ncbi:MAG: hypothetical protein HYV09_04250 [Deltaproteobacteria bacterium]|nr:hypothetical protein [Deltaproteobacteria bacterium]
MRRRRTSPARSLAALVIMALFGIALVFFPLRSRAVAKGGAPAKPVASGSAKLAASASAFPSGSASAAEGVAPFVPHGAASASALPPGAEPALSIPTGKGLPVSVNVAVFFLELKAFDDTKGEFDCTTDVRYRWTDLRLKFEKREAYRGYKEWRGNEAEDELAKIWKPNIDVTNRLESSSYVGHRLRIFPSGDVELITRMTAKYKVAVNAERFPFDRQYLVLDFLVREETTDEVVLRFNNEDVQWSRVSKNASLDGWDPGLVDLDADVVQGWNGDRYAKLTASLFVDRLATTGLAPIFIPLVASLLIPLLAIWMNKATPEGFEVEAFELANMGIGGLFSVIALSFAIYTSYAMIAGGDNTVTRLFGLNYATLALSLTIVVVLFRYNIVRRWWGPYVHEQVFKWIAWAMPVLTLGTSVAFLLVAAQ